MIKSLTTLSKHIADAIEVSSLFHKGGTKNSSDIQPKILEILQNSNGSNANEFYNKINSIAGFEVAFDSNLSLELSLCLAYNNILIKEVKRMNKAQSTLKENILDRLINYNDHICTRREFIKTIVNNGGYAEMKQVPSLQYNRVKYNRMNAKEQDEFDRKASIKKNEYRLYKNDGSFYELNKTEYNYANSLGGLTQ